MRMTMPIGAPASGLVNRQLVSAQGSYALTGKAASLTYVPVGATGTWPDDEFDARFASNTHRLNSAGPVTTTTGGTISHLTISGSGAGQGNQADIAIGYNDYTAEFCALVDVSEGFRVSGQNCVVTDCYVRLGNTAVGDHGDTWQAFNFNGNGPAANWANIVIRNTKIVIPSGQFSNAAVFSADNAGINLTLENVYIIAHGAPHGCIWLPNAGNDWGVRSVNFNNVLVEGGDGSTTGIIGIGPEGRTGTLNPTVVQWVNVRNSNGTTYTPQQCGIN